MLLPLRSRVCFATPETQAMESELYQWIRAQEAAGTHHSQGKFTLAQEKAWEKLGAFQLPFQEAWVLKLIQGAVRAGATAIDVTQSRTDTQFQIRGDLGWSWSQLESALFHSSSKPSRALEHLMVGVRALAKSTTRPFSLKFGEEPSLTWNGRIFEQARRSLGQGPALTLTASHFEVGESQSVLSLNNFEASAVSSSILTTLRHHCFVCPIPLSVDGRLINGFPQDEYYQPRESCRPVAFVAVEPSHWLPDFSLNQPKNWRQAVVSDLKVTLEGDEIAFAGDSEPAGGMALLCAFLETVGKGQSPKIRTRNGHSTLVWVGDGVVVKRDKLSIYSPVGVLALVSAEGMETDLTGLTLKPGHEMTERKRHVLWKVAEQLERLQGDIEVSGSASIWSYWGWDGLVMSLLSPRLGLIRIGQSVASWWNQDQQRESLDRSFDRGLEKLIEGLKKWRPTA